MNRTVLATVVALGLTVTVGSGVILDFGKSVIDGRTVALVGAPAPVGSQYDLKPLPNGRFEISADDLNRLVEDRELRREIALREWDYKHRSELDGVEKIVDAIVKLVGAVSSLFGMYALGRNGSRP